MPKQNPWTLIPASLSSAFLFHFSRCKIQFSYRSQDLFINQLGIPAGVGWGCTCPGAEEVVCEGGVSSEVGRLVLEVPSVCRLRELTVVPAANLHPVRSPDNTHTRTSIIWTRKSVLIPVLEQSSIIIDDWLKVRRLITFDKLVKLCIRFVMKAHITFYTLMIQTITKTAPGLPLRPSLPPLAARVIMPSPAPPPPPPLTDWRGTLPVRSSRGPRAAGAGGGWAESSTGTRHSKRRRPMRAGPPSRSPWCRYALQPQRGSGESAENWQCNIYWQHIIMIYIRSEYIIRLYRNCMRNLASPNKIKGSGHADGQEIS